MVPRSSPASSHLPAFHVSYLPLCLFSAMGYYITRCLACGHEIARGVGRCPHCNKSCGLFSRMFIILRHRLRFRKRR
jgi:hypothetical protein